MKDLVSADVEVVEGPFNKLLRIKKPQKSAKNAFSGQHFAKKGTIFSKKICNILFRQRICPTIKTAISPIVPPLPAQACANIYIHT